MAMKVRYTVVDGEVIAEIRGGVRKLYSPDTLGNTRALYDSTLAKTDTFSYFPFGNVASRTGTTKTPFQWVGGSGYFQDSGSRTYVRARTMYTSLARWNKQDPIGFDAGDVNLYRYVENKSVTFVDRFGRQSDTLSAGCGCFAPGLALWVDVGLSYGGGLLIPYCDFGFGGGLGFSMGGGAGYGHSTSSPPKPRSSEDSTVIGGGNPAFGGSVSLDPKTNMPTGGGVNVGPSIGPGGIYMGQQRTWYGDDLKDLRNAIEDFRKSMNDFFQYRIW